MTARLLFCHALPLFAMLAATCFAQQPRKLAVVVGVDVYRTTSGLPPLQYASNDAHELAEVLREQDYTVFEMTHAVARQPGNETLAPNVDYIRDQIKRVLGFPNLGANDSVILSFHGHGVQFEFTTNSANGNQDSKMPKFFFCPADTTIQELRTANEITERNRLLPLDELYADLEKCTAATRLLIVDACRNDPTRPGVFRSGLASATLPKLPPPPGGIAAFFSCKANEQALEDPDFKQGVFTHFLVEGLRGTADQPISGRPADGIVTFAELSAYVANNTYAYVVIDKKLPAQSPQLRGDIDLNLPLARQIGPAKEFTNSIGMEFALIPAGTFTMGSPTTEPDRSDRETQHTVTLSRDFYMGKYEVTQSEFQRVMGFNPSRFTDSDRLPVETVTWFDAVMFCNKLSELEGRQAAYTISAIQKDGDSIQSANVSIKRGANGYRLPTEAEWEYACRAGATSPFSFGANITTDQVNYNGNYPYDGGPKGLYREKTVAVDALTQANEFGLFRMHGNVAEWCADWYGDYPSGSVTDPQGPSRGSVRVYRGGSWNYNARYCRSANRNNNTPGNRNNNLGFRVAVGR